MDAQITTRRLRLTPSAARAPDGRFEIVDRGSGSIVGAIALRAARHSRVRGLELTYGVAPGARGRGICSEAARGLVGYAFSHGLTARVYASAAWSNIASRRVLAGLGMRQLDIAMLDWESLAGEVDPVDGDLTPYARVEYEMHLRDFRHLRSAPLPRRLSS